MGRKIDYFSGLSSASQYFYLWIADNNIQTVRPENSYIVPLSTADYEGVKLTLDIIYGDVAKDLNNAWHTYDIEYNNRSFTAWLSTKKYSLGYWPACMSTLDGGAPMLMEHLMEWKPKDD